MAIIRYLLGLRIGQGNTDDIDHLGNRRVRLGRRVTGQPIQYRPGRAWHGLFANA